MDVIRITKGDYTQYEELLLQRDQFEKEAMEYQMAYTRVFGALVVDTFKEKMECISLKKAISFCQTAKNFGKEIDEEELSAYLDTHMAAYKAELNKLIEDKKNADSGKPISELQVREIKTIYRRIAKLLHPDINPLTRSNAHLMDLFQSSLIAYKCNNLKRLRELEVLIHQALNELGEETPNVVLDDVDEKMEELEKEINEIISTEPYLYKNILEDEMKIIEKKAALEKELTQYKEYRAQLQQIYDELLNNEE